MTKTHFGDVLNISKLIIGLSGTANEQAAGMGCPIITFPGKGWQITPRFVAGQRKLLGDAVRITGGEKEEIAKAVFEILSDKRSYENMVRAGRERMGNPGASQCIARRIRDIFIEGTSLA